MKTLMTLCAALLPAISVAMVTDAQATTARAAEGPYQVAQVYHVGGKGNWDYLTVDSAHQLLYVPRTTHTLVLDAKTGKTVADIPGQKGNHGVALVPSAGRGFITDGKDGSVVVFDLKTNEVLGNVKTAEDADGILYDETSGKVLVSCGDAGVVVPLSADVDPKSGSAGQPLAVGGKPEALAADGNGKVYVTVEDKNYVAVIDIKALKVVDKWPTTPGGAPVGLAIDREHHRLFVGCRNPQTLVVMSADDGKVLANLPIGAGCDGALFDDGTAFASCRDGSLTAVKETAPGKFEVVQTLKTRPGAKTMGVDPTTHTIYLPTAELEQGGGRRGRNRPRAKPDSFMVLVVRRTGN
jgi:outer membrane protein assembly factor BamB